MNGMETVSVRSLDAPDESRRPDKTQVDVVRLGEGMVARLRMQPGWRWSDCVKPLVGTELCQAQHFGYVVAGALHVVSGDGTEADLCPGDGYRLAPGHDAWVVGDEQFEALEFEQQTAATYARS